MQIIVKALEEIFPEAQTRSDLGNVKCNVPQLNTEHLVKLGELSILYKIEVKRSGTGLVIIVQLSN